MSDERDHPLDADLEREIEQALDGASLLGLDKPSAPRGTVPLDTPDQAPTDEPEAGAFADATVSGVGTEDVFVEFGPRAQGVLSADQFSAPPDVGEVVRVYVERFDAKEGLWICALKKTLQAAAGWGSVEPGAVVMVTARAVNKGGLEVQVGHLTGFLPASHVSLHRVEDLETVVGETFAVEIIEADPDKRRLVVSRRAVLARERDRQTNEAMENLQPGSVLSGTVTRVQPFGAFVDIGGVEGLVHVSQMAWKRVENPEDVVSVGDQIKVTVLEVKPEDGRISLGMKQLQEDPWMRFTVDHPAGSVMEGTVTRLAHFGAFVEVAEGVEGLAHISQLAPHNVSSPREVVRVGDKISVRIVNVEPERRRIGLSLLTGRGDRLTDDVADDATIRDHLGPQGDDAPEPTLGDLLKKAMEDSGGK